VPKDERPCRKESWVLQVTANPADLIMTAILANFYSYIIAEYSKKLKWLWPNSKIKKFISSLTQDMQKVSK
jgi:hypothetical protein